MSTYYGGVSGGDELAHLLKDTLTVDGFIQRASLHDDGHRKQHLLSHILLETVARPSGKGRETESEREKEPGVKGCREREKVRPRGKERKERTEKGERDVDHMISKWTIKSK